VLKPWLRQVVPPPRVTCLSQGLSTWGSVCRDRCRPAHGAHGSTFFTMMASGSASHLPLSDTLSYLYLHMHFVWWHPIPWPQTVLNVTLSTYLSLTLLEYCSPPNFLQSIANCLLTSIRKLFWLRFGSWNLRLKHQWGHAPPEGSREGSFLSSSSFW
jgi:hypothetical protein